jgi:hypothetical protein
LRSFLAIVIARTRLFSCSWIVFPNCAVGTALAAGTALIAERGIESKAASAGSCTMT